MSEWNSEVNTGLNVEVSGISNVPAPEVGETFGCYIRRLARQARLSDVNVIYNGKTLAMNDNLCQQEARMVSGSLAILKHDAPGIY